MYYICDKLYTAIHGREVSVKTLSVTAWEYRRMLKMKQVECPNCGADLEFDLSDLDSED